MQKSQPLLNGSAEAEKILKNISKLKTKPCLAVVLVGSDPASQIYVNIKQKKAEKLGIKFKKYLLPANNSEKNILNLINKLNNKKNIHGILLQLPLPKKFNKNSVNKIIKKINPDKDVDGLLTTPNPSLKRRGVIPPTIQAIIKLIKLSKIKLQNKKAIILANSSEFAEEVGKNLNNKIKYNILLKNKIKNNINLKKYNIIIIALGKKYWLKPEMIKKDCVVIDVGINRIKNSNKIYGDVHPDCFKKSKYISPVPGGVGPLTVVFLFRNLFTLTNHQ